MSKTQQDAPSRKAELSEVAGRLSSKLEDARGKIANQLARGLRKMGLHGVADLVSLP